MVIHFMTPKDLVVQYQKTPSKPPFYKTAVKKECLLPFPNLFVKGKVRGCSNVSMVMVQLVVVLASTWVIYTVLHTMGTNKL